MRVDRFKTHVLIAVAGLLASACSSIQPSHYGKFTFQGVVKDERDAPIHGAWVKIRGWETLTDTDGRWRQEQVIHCGTLREYVDPYEENDSILVTKEGFEPAEENFVVKHPGWFQSCESAQIIAFETTMARKGNKVAKPGSNEQGPILKRGGTDI